MKPRSVDSMATRARMALVARRGSHHLSVFAAFAVLLASCKPTIAPGPFLCAKDSECPAAWFCASDRHCHHRSRGEPLACASGTDCGGGWHCGALGVCYDRADAGAELQCRRSESNADAGYSGGDCGDRFRCGVDARCHPDADAGAISCDYAADFADCTDGWRCSFGGRCLDPAGEALEPATRQLAAPVLIRNLVPASAVVAVSEPSRVKMAIATLDDAGLRLFQRVARPPLMMQPTEAEDFTGYSLSVTPLPVSGSLSGPLVAEAESVTFFRDGALSRVSVSDGGAAGSAVTILTVDGGSLTLAGATQRTVSQLRPLAGQAVAAFRPGGDGYWEVPPAGPARWVERAGFVELIDFTTPTLIASCRLEARESPPGMLNVGLKDAGADPCSSFVEVPFLPLSSRVEVGIAGGDPLAAVAITVDTAPGSSEDGLLFIPEGVPLEQLPICPQACGPGVHIGEFWPFAPRPGVLAAEVLCEPQGIGGQRWRQLIEVAAPLCREVRLSRRLTAFFAQHLEPAAETRRGGTYARYEPNFTTGNGQVWAGSDELPQENSLATAEPWFVDRPPLVVAEFSLFLPDGGSTRAILASGGDTTAALTSSGFVAHREVTGIVDALRPEQGLLTLTDQGELRGALENRVYARVDLPSVPAEAELHVVAVPRADGAAEWVVAVDDQLFAGRGTNGGRLVTLVAAARPAPGFSIISLAAGPSTLAGTDQAEFYAATRASLFRVHLDALNRWRADELQLSTNLDYLEVWVTTTGRVRVADRSGSVYSLPSGLRLSGPLPSGAGTAQDFLSTCGHDFVLSDSDAWVLGPPVDGIAQWEPLHLVADSFSGGRLFEVINGLFAFGSRGEALRIDCPP